MNKLDKFRTMIRLALVDENFDEKERVFIKDLAKLHKVSNKDIETLIEEECQNKEGVIPIMRNLDFEGKIELLADLVRIMKVDGDIYLSEIKFCEMIAQLFGFKQKSIGFLSENIHGGTSVAPDWESIHSKMKKYVA